MQKVQGFSEQGNTTLTISGSAGTIARKVQGSFPSATITVYLAGTLTLASIYSDNLSTPTAKANPFVSSSDGTWFFYAANGSYDVKFSGGGIAAPFTLGDIRLFDESILWIDVTSSPYNAKGNGSADDTAAIQAAIDAVPSDGGTVYFPTPPSAYIITSTLNVSHRSRIKFCCSPTQGGVDSTFFKWNGANGGTVLFLDCTRDSSFSDFAIWPGTGTIGIGILIDQVNPSGSQLSANNKFSRILIGASTCAVQIGKDQIDGNNAEHTFEDVYITHAGTYGYYIKFSQSRNISFMRGSIADRTTGIYHNNGSSRLYGVNFSANTTDVFIQQADDTISISSCHSENSSRFFDTAGFSGVNFACHLNDNQFLNATPDPIIVQYKFNGPFLMTGNDFAAGTYNTSRFNISGFSNTPVNSLGNIFPNNTVFTGAVGSYSLTSIGDRALDNTSTPIAMPNVTQANFGITGSLTVSNDITVTDDLTVGDDASVGGDLAITGTLTAPTISGNTNVTGSVTVGNDVTITDDLSVGDAAAVGTISVGGETAQAHLLSGTYTPTLTNVFNVSASSLVEDPSYLQIGKTIVVSGRISITPTATGNVTTEVDLSVPVLNSSNIDAMGGAVTSGLVGLSGVATFQVSFGNANKIRFTAGQVDTTAAINYSFVLSYHLT